MSAPFTDDADTAHLPAGPDARILSLVPSITELLFEMGLESQIAGRTAFCVHPADRVQSIPSVGGTKRINMEKVAETGATHTIVNVDETPKQMADALADTGLQVIVTHPIEARDNLKLFRLIGGLFDRQDAAETLCVDFDAALTAIDDSLSARKVLYLIWQDPWMTISSDTYISRFFALGNLQTIGHDPAVRYPEVVLDEELLSNADHVLFSTEPFSFTETHLEEFRAAFPDHAAKAKLIDAEMVSWYGSRAIAGLRYLASFRESLKP